MSQIPHESQDVDAPHPSPDIAENVNTRHDLQLGRRFFHFFNGFTIATLYFAFIDYAEAVHTLGLVVSLFYIFEQVRIHYPEISQKTAWLQRMFLRAEERLKESAALPYIVACLLVIVSCPKPVALVAIYSLAIADPLSAIVGITRGKHKISARKSVEGSMAFFFSILGISFLVLSATTGFTLQLIFVSITIAVICTLIELVPLRIDDNLTIPLFVSITTWIVCWFAGIPLLKAGATAAAVVTPLFTP